MAASCQIINMRFMNMATKKKVTAPDPVYWVVMTRSFLTWKVESMHSSYAKAQDYCWAKYMSGPADRNIKIERVELIG